MGSVQRQRSPEQKGPREAGEARGRGCGEAGSPGRAHHGENARVERGQDNAYVILVGGLLILNIPTLRQ